MFNTSCSPQRLWNWIKQINPTLLILLGAFCGTALGLTCHFLSVSQTIVEWIYLPGILFLRALKGLVVPLVFCSLTSGVTELLKIGRAAVVGRRTACLYLLTTLIASIEGILWVLVFKRWYSSSSSTTTITTSSSTTTQQAPVELQCMDATSFMSTYTNITSIVSCGGTNGVDSKSNETTSSNYTMIDLNNHLSYTTNTLSSTNAPSLSAALQSMLKDMVPENITMAFAEGSLLSIIMFSISFGCALAIYEQNKTQQRKCNKQLPKQQHDPYLPVVSDPKVLRRSTTISRNTQEEESSHLSELIKKAYVAFSYLLHIVVALTPIGVCCLLAGTLASRDDLVQVLKTVGFVVITAFVGLIGHLIFVYPMLLALVAKQSLSEIYSYMSRLLPAMICAIGCGSSMATLPITIQCVKDSNSVSQTLIDFILPLGATVNMDGSALYYPAYIVFLVESGTIDIALDLATVISIVIASTLGSMGNAPVPQAGLIMTMTIWATVFPQIPLPETYAYIMAINWLIAPFGVAVNVTGDAVSIVNRVLLYYVCYITNIYI